MTAAAVPEASFLEGLLADAGIALPEEAVGKLVRHAGEMLRWNRSIRLTAITDPAEVAVKHILDSLLLLRFAPFPGVTLDVGSGAGYPGIPLAVALPESRFLLLDASAKKCAFLSRVRLLLDLPNVAVRHGRLDRRSSLPIGPFAQVVTRATFPPGEAAALLIPYLAAGGRLLLMTGPGAEGERGAGSAGRGEGPGRRAAGVAGRPAGRLGRRDRGAAPQAEGGSGVYGEGARAGRRFRFDLPFGMGVREILEVVREGEDARADGGAAPENGSPRRSRRGTR